MPTSGPRALLGMTYTEKLVEGRKTSESEMRFRTRPKTGVLRPRPKTGLLDRRPKTGVYAGAQAAESG